MSGLFGSLRSAASGLYSSQLRIDLAANNIARADDPTYSRQRALLGAAGYRMIGGGAIGSGVEVTGIVRDRDSLLDARYRGDQAQAEGFSHMSATLGEIETLFDATSDFSLGTVLSQFWAGWEELSNNPDDSSARVNLVGNAQHLGRTLNDIDGQLRSTVSRLDEEIVGTVSTINQLTDQIARINDEIAAVSQGGRSMPNDLLDARDAMVDELSRYLDVTVTHASTGIRVHSGGMLLVDGNSTHELSTSEGRIIYATDGTDLRPRGGILAAAIEERDEVIPELMSALDEIAETIAREVNRVHRSGTSANGLHTGLDFFSGTTARDLRVASDIAADASKVASSASGLPGDNETALAIAALRHASLMSDGTATIEEAYANLVSSVGITASEAQFSGEMAIAMLAQSASDREQVKGVNLDEEMVDLISLQNAYQASAQVVSTIDALMQDTLSMLG